MPIAVAGIHRRGSSRRRLTNAWPAPMTSPVTAPPSSAASGLSTRPATAVPARPARGKARNPAVQINQVRRNDGRNAAERVMVLSSSAGGGRRGPVCRAAADVAARRWPWTVGVRRADAGAAGR